MSLVASLLYGPSHALWVSAKLSLGIGVIDGIIYFDIIKPVGKKEMNIKNYINGKRF